MCEKEHSVKLLNAKDFGASGSIFEAVATTVSGSRRIDVDNIGDFSVGDEVILNNGYSHHVCEMFMDRRDNSPINPRPWQHGASLENRVELRGTPSDEWVAYFIDLYPEEPNVFRWTKDYGRTWHESIPITEGWIDLDGDVEVKIGNFAEREWGCTAIIVCSTRLVATIERIDGNSLYLSKEANLDSKCVIRHSDTAAIQRAIDAALKEKKGVFLPNGRYRLTSSLVIKDAEGFTFEGESGVNTILDNSLGAVGAETYVGSCLYVERGKEVNIKNLFMIGCAGFEERDQCTNLRPKGGDSVWGFYFHKSNATCVIDTERVYIENCHARRMSGECFYAVGHRRTPPDPDPEFYTKSITYMRCSVEDCARNAFNTAIQSERTSLLYCRIKDVGGCAWEGASRFTNIEGCYFRNAGSIGIGNSRRRNIFHEYLTCGQHHISGNFFESGCSYSKAMIRVGAAAAQVIITGNSFINFNSNAIQSFGEGGVVDLPSENVIISSNAFDMTATENESESRCAIRITNNFVTVADNQIYVRGECDKNVNGIEISDDVTRLQIHDNTIAGCGKAIVSEKVIGKVGRVADEKTFYREEGRQGDETKPMLLRRRSHLYRGWTLEWLKDGSKSEIDFFDAEKLTFNLKEPKTIEVGDEFMIYSDVSAPWNIHDNIIDDCETPLALDTEARKCAILRNNIIHN